MPLGDTQGVLHARVDRQRDDLRTRDHDFAGGLIAEGERTLDELPFRSGHQPRARRLAHQHLQLFR